MQNIEELLKGCLKHNEKAKEMMYKSFYGYIMAIVLRYVNDRDEAEEVVNDCYVKIFKHLGTFTLPETNTEILKAFKGWASKISSRTSIDFLRSKKPSMYMEDIDDIQQPITEVNVITKLNVQDILSLLNQLPPVQKIIFNMYEIEGFSHDEIAEQLGISGSASRVYLTRAKSKLRELYSRSLIHSYAN